MIRTYVTLIVKPNSPLIYRGGPIVRYINALRTLSGREHWGLYPPPCTTQKREMRQYINVIQGRGKDSNEPYPRGYIRRYVGNYVAATVLISYGALKHIYEGLEDEKNTN